MTAFLIDAGGVAAGVALFAVIIRLLEMWLPDVANYIKNAFDAPAFA